MMWAQPAQVKRKSETVVESRAINRLGDHGGIPEDELLNELSEKEQEEVSPEVERVVVEATSAPGFDEVRAEQGLPCVPSVSSSSGDLMRRVDLVFTILRTWKSLI